MSGSKRHNKNERTVAVWKKIFGMQKLTKISIQNRLLKLQIKK